MPSRVEKRVRRSATEARTRLIECAEKLLRQGGPSAVQMRAVARQAGMTDAGVAHHFGGRDGLLQALLNHAAAKLRSDVAMLVENWLQSGPDLETLVEKLGALYGRGYAELALELYRSGWKEKGPPVLQPVVDSLIAANKNPETSDDDIRCAVASLHFALALDPLFGAPFRHSAGLFGSDAQARQITWWLRTMKKMLRLG